MSMTFLSQKLEREIKNDKIKNGKILNKVIEPVIDDWGERYLVARDPESAFLHFKNKTLPIFKECIKNLFAITPSTEKENAEYLKTLDERINEANKVSEFDKTLTIRYQFEVGNGLVNFSFKKLLKEHLDLRKENPYSLEKEIDFIKKNIGFAVSRYVKSYMKSEKSRFGPKGIYDTSPLGQAELKFAFDEILKFKVSKVPVLPSLKPENYYEIGIEDRTIIYDISNIMEKASDKYGNLRYFISRYGTKPLCYPNMCFDFLLEKNYKLVGTYLEMIGYLKVPEFKLSLIKPLEYVA
ncbi:MAG: hypothetical protein QXP77_02330 [Candidatus Aenigmatarchaeota archaeon]